MEPNTNDQQFVPPTPVTPIQTPKKGFNWKKVLYFIAVAIAAAALSGVCVWAYMSNQNDNDNKSLKAQITTKDKTITGLQSNVKSLKTQFATVTGSKSSSSQQTTSSLDMFKSLVTFCGSNSKTVNYTTLTNEPDGVNYFGHCSVMEKGALTGGYVITANYTDASWQEIYKGQGPAQSSVCTQYKIPSVLGTCV